MKFTLFARKPRKVSKVAKTIEAGRDWTIADWADLPTYHPRSN